MSLVKAVHKHGKGMREQIAVEKDHYYSATYLEFGRMYFLGICAFMSKSYYILIKTTANYD